MTFSLPIWIEEEKSRGGEVTFTAGPVFGNGPLIHGPKLSRVLSRLGAEVRKIVNGLGKEARHDELAAWMQSPNLESHRFDIRIETKTGSAVRPFFFIGWPSLDRRVFKTPSLPELLFDVATAQSLPDRAASVINQHLRNELREGASLDLRHVGARGNCWLTFIDIPLDPSTRVPIPTNPLRALLGGGAEEAPDGATELQRTSQRLNDGYPDDLDRAVGREPEVTELLRALSTRDRRPVLLLGPRKAGKTAVIHEAVRRMEAAKRQRQQVRAGEKPAGIVRTGADSQESLEEVAVRPVWHVSPMRLISGMSFLGQWENRVLAILDHVAGRDGVLYFDDLMGLYTAGISQASDLNVAAVLKAYMERRPVRLLGEITSEAWRLIRERDRTFADQFQIIPIRELPLRETWEVLIDFSRQLETQHRCAFTADVVPLTVNLHQRFIRDAAFPGKAAGFLRRLAANHARHPIRREQVIEEFTRQTSLACPYLDSSETGAYWDHIGTWDDAILGQPAVLEAFIQISHGLRARLNDTTRPLGTLLLLGPTGVGKTHSAKMLAQFLFGSADKLVRFDMNEYVDPGSILRLTGTPMEPEGLLTGTLRRQPFCVLLFDEIEKAAPEFFDLLLAVLDEGRLTDSLGRVADFTNCVILLTSNLGAREARTSTGFVPTERGAAETYRNAAEKFFRPEFFNRLDRIIPFAEFRPEDLERIARIRIEEIAHRQGIRQRRCMITVTPAALSRLVALGHHPELGARALKRVFEHELTQPLAEHLATVTPGHPLKIRFDSDGSRFELTVTQLSPRDRVADWSQHIPAWTAHKPAGGHSLEQLLDAIRDALDAFEERLDQLAPSGPIALGNVHPAQAHAIFCREQLQKVDRLVQWADRQRRHSDAKPIRVLNASRAKSINLLLVRRFFGGDPRPDSLRAAESLRFDLKDLHEQDDTTELPDSPVAAVLREFALLEIMMESAPDEPALTLAIAAETSSQLFEALALCQVYERVLRDFWGYSISRIREHSEDRASYIRATPPHQEAAYQHLGLVIRGPGARRLLAAQAGLNLEQSRDGSFSAVQVRILDVPTVEEARAVFTRWGTTPPPAEVHPLVVRTRMSGVEIVDYPSGLKLTADPTDEEWRAALLSSLPISLLQSV